jgi:hypothetical protein
VKGKTNINIISGGNKPPQPMPVPVPVGGPPGGPPSAMPMPKPPMPVMPVGAAPGPMPAPGMGGPGGMQMPPGAMPPMGRKDGGRVNGESDSDYRARFGSRSGMGRLDKSRHVKRSGMAP